MSNSNNFSDDEMLISKSPTIDMVTQRKLAELQELNKLLTIKESNQIMKVYLSALNRIMKENGKEF